MEPLENATEVVGGNSDSSIANGKDSLSEGGTQGDLNRSLSSVLDGVLSSCVSNALDSRTRPTHSDDIVNDLLPEIQRNVHVLNIGRIVVAGDDEL